MDIIPYITCAVVALVAGGYGLYKVAFAQGYVNGYEDASETVFTPDE